MDGGRVAVAPQHDDGGEHVQHSIKLQSENTDSSDGGGAGDQRNSHVFSSTSHQTYSKSKGGGAVAHDGDGCKKTTLLIHTLDFRKDCSNGSSEMVSSFLPDEEKSHFKPENKRQIQNPPFCYF